MPATGWTANDGGGGGRDRENEGTNWNEPNFLLNRLGLGEIGFGFRSKAKWQRNGLNVGPATLGDEYGGRRGRAGRAEGRRRPIWVIVMPTTRPILRCEAVAVAAEQSQFRDWAGSRICATPYLKTHRSYGTPAVHATKHKLLMPLRQFAVTEKGLLGSEASESRGRGER
jgi:hypothetical protein